MLSYGIAVYTIAVVFGANNDERLIYDKGVELRELSEMIWEVKSGKEGLKIVCCLKSVRTHKFCG
jgi:hypothetical protein